MSTGLDARRDAALSGLDVSRETLEKLEAFASELRRWQRIKNLVAPSTLAEVWKRHIADSLQLIEVAPDARTWLDLGTGAGFPGMVIAIVAAERNSRVHLVESNSRKCAFLRHVARLTGARAIVHEARIEAVVPTLIGQVDVVTARAVAPLTQLLGWTAPLLSAGTTGLFPKGRGALLELTEARESWRFNVDILPSRTDPDSRILRITSLANTKA